jgi:hypothetical protein
MDHQTAQGVLKHQPDRFFPAFLHCYLYSGNVVLDSVKVEHPLYRHLEFVSGEKSMSSKDTLVDNADFFIRFQTQKNVNEIRITETVPEKPLRVIAIIKI